MKVRMASTSLAIVVLAALLVGFGFARSGGLSAGGELDEATGKDGKEAALAFGGDRGTEFSGTCIVDGEERAFEGEVPERLEFSPNDGRLECEISKEDPGSIELTFTAAENVRTVQRFDGPESTVRLSYENGGLSTSTTSSGGMNSSLQQTIISESSRR